MNIIKIGIQINTRSTDHVFVYTDFPSPWPMISGEELCLRFDVAAGSGIAYVEKHFPEVPYEVLNLARVVDKFAR